MRLWVRFHAPDKWTAELNCTLSGLVGSFGPSFLRTTLAANKSVTNKSVNLCFALNIKFQT